MTTETIGKEALDHVCGDAASFYDDNHTKYRESCQKKEFTNFFHLCQTKKKIKFWEQVRPNSNQKTRKKEYFIPIFFQKNTRF